MIATAARTDPDRKDQPSEISSSYTYYMHVTTTEDIRSPLDIPLHGHSHWVEYYGQCWGDKRTESESRKREAPQSAGTMASHP